MATILDVAQKAGVSAKTVSRHLSGYQGISARTVEKIEAAARELEFFPSAAARSLRGQSSGIVSLITDNLTTTPFSYEIVQGVQSVCERQGKILMIGEARDNVQTFHKLVDRFRQQKVEAVLKATFFHKAIVVQQKFERCPLVMVNCFDPEHGFPSIVPDDEQGARDLTLRLLEMGHRRIAHLMLPEGMVATDLRHKGYTAALQSKGVPYDSGLVFNSKRMRPEEDVRWIDSTLAALLGAAEPVTAIMCGNDKMALRVLMRLRDRGMKVPMDVSVVGFDDFTPISENTLPALTTVRLPYYRMGERAAELALSLSNGEENSAGTEICHCEIIARNSDSVPPHNN